MARQSAAKDELIQELSEASVHDVGAELEREEQEQAAARKARAEGAVAADNMEPIDFDAAKTTRKPQAKPFVFDDKNWHLTVNDKHGVFECDLMGMNPHVQMRLAATGLASLLRGRANKQKLLEGIMGGQFGGKRRQSYPATVIAYAAVYGVTVEAAYAEWKQLDNAGKMVIRQSPRIRIALAQMAAERESVQAE